MRRPLGALLLVLLCALAGCGDDGSPDATDPAPSSTAGDPSGNDTGTATPETATDLPTTSDPSGPPTKSPPLTPGGVPFELLGILSATAGRGEVSDVPVEITSAADADAFVAPLSEPLAADVRDALATALDAPDAAGRQILAAVVGLGCDVPPGVDVTESTDGYAVTGLKVADPLPNCVAPVTSVAIVAVA